MKTQLFIILFLLSFCSTIHCQNLINSFYFDAGEESWTSQTISNSAYWEWKGNGKADYGLYWNSRDSIRSNSLGGAMVYDGDGIISSGIGNPDSIYFATLTSPPLDFSSESSVFLKFNQYYRNYESTTRVQVSVDSGANWNTVFNNNNVKQNIETSSADYQVIDISMEAGTEPNVLVRFLFEGDYYFWIIDDVEFYDSYPYPRTFPSYVGDSLSTFGIPYSKDDADWVYVPNEIVIQFKAGTTEAEKQDLRDTLGATKIDSCVCNQLELWILNNSILGGDQNLSPYGGTIDINERVKGATSSSTVDGVDLNKYNYNELKNNPTIPNDPLGSIPSGIQTSPTGATLIAILDTGIDIDHDSLVNYIYLNNDQLNNNSDDDSNCYPDDPIGWNFVDDNNNPDDDHGHGTHVAGIIKQNAEQYDNCDFRIIPYKTHDSFGVSNLFDVTCATYQALKDNASVINDSWGFYGDSSIILSNALDTAFLNNTLVVTASGNDTFDLAVTRQYPACYDISNVLTVGALGVIPNGDLTDTINLAFSNYDPVCVDILAPGKDILSTIPPLPPGNANMGKKSGTSMAAPAVSAAAAIAYCAGYSNAIDVKNNILNCAIKNSIDLADQVMDGNILNLDFPCLTPIEEVSPLSPLDFLAYPNPLNDWLYVTLPNDAEDISIELFNISGQSVFLKHLDRWGANVPKRFNLKEVPSGIYFLIIKQKYYIGSHKLIKF